MLILDDNRLLSLLCSKCHKYLSVFPVKNQPTSREVTCGRCSGVGDDDGVRSTLYELVAKKYLFKCINHYEGCRKLLRADEAEAHESDCIGNVFHCPKCKDGVDMSVLQLIWHYKLRHTSSYLKKSRFVWRPPSEDVMLYIQDDVVFFVLLRSESGSTRFSAVTLTNVEATQSFSIGRESIFERTETRTCKPMGVSGGDSFIFDSDEPFELILDFKVSKSDSLYDVSVPSSSGAEEAAVPIPDGKPFAVRLTADLKERLSYKLNDNGTAIGNEFGHKIGLTCFNCGQVIGLPLFNCTKSRHRICYGCRVWCGTCDCSVVQSKSKDILLAVSAHLKFACKWKCGGYFTFDLRSHESVCGSRIKQCPKCLSLIPLQLMKDHIFAKYQRYFCEEYDVDEVMDIICSNKNGRIYFLLKDEWCYLEWSSLSSKQCKLDFLPVDENLDGHLYIIYSNSMLPCTDFPLNIQNHDIPLYKPYFKFK